MNRQVRLNVTTRWGQVNATTQTINASTTWNSEGLFQAAAVFAFLGLVVALAGRQSASLGMR